MNSLSIDRNTGNAAGNAVTLQDGYGEWRQFPYARVGFGKMKTPPGLEQLASAAELEGIAGSYGKKESSVASHKVRPALGSYVTPGQQRFFRYRTTSATTDVVAADGKTVNVPLTTVLTNTTVADGRRYRIMPQGYWYWRQYGAFGEYLQSAHAL